MAWDIAVAGTVCLDDITTPHGHRENQQGGSAVYSALAASRWQSAAERPAFQALIYPALPKDMKLSKDTPPAFLACGENDRQNISQGLPELYLAMKKAGASAELHVFSGVGHGFGLRETTKGEVAGWLARFHEWMGVRGYLKP